MFEKLAKEPTIGIYSQLDADRKHRLARTLLYLKESGGFWIQKENMTTIIPSIIRPGSSSVEIAGWPVRYHVNGILSQVHEEFPCHCTVHRAQVWGGVDISQTYKTCLRAYGNDNSDNVDVLLDFNRNDSVKNAACVFVNPLLFFILINKKLLCNQITTPAAHRLDAKDIIRCLSRTVLPTNTNTRDVEIKVDELENYIICEDNKYYLRVDRKVLSKFEDKINSSKIKNTVPDTINLQTAMDVWYVKNIEVDKHKYQEHFMHYMLS
jgi:hypothetical protein